jgi:hypothetical protein
MLGLGELVLLFGWPTLESIIRHSTIRTRLVKSEWLPALILVRTVGYVRGSDGHLSERC